MSYDIIEKINRWRNKEISDSDIALYFFLSTHLKKYPNKNLERAIANNVSNDLLNSFTFKKVKDKALKSLVKLCNGTWNFIIIEKIPTPKEVLEYQAQGIRPVTMKFQEDFKPILMREDCLEFFLHDLEHGYMFFHDETLKNMQISFFKKVNNALSLGLFDKYLSNKNFLEKFDYLISDMNSHTEHYKHYLFSMLPREDISKFDFLFEEV